MSTQFFEQASTQFAKHNQEMERKQEAFQQKVRGEFTAQLKLLCEHLRQNTDIKQIRVTSGMGVIAISGFISDKKIDLLDTANLDPSIFEGDDSDDEVNAELVEFCQPIAKFYSLFENTIIKGGVESGLVHYYIDDFTIGEFF